jgi:hypothetical protein
MTIPTATQLVDGDTATWSNFLDGVILYRGWLNAVPAADIPAATINTEHLVRPRLFARRFEGQRQIVMQDSFGVETPPAAERATWAARPQRLAIPLPHLGAGGTWRLPLGFRLTLPAAADVRIRAGFEWQVRAWNTATAAASPTYPTSSDGTSTTLGYFSLHTRRAFDLDGVPADASADEKPLTRNYVYPMLGDAIDDNMANSAGAWIRTHGDTGGFIWSADDMSAGTWDLALVYTAPSPVPEGAMQIDVSAWSATLHAYL